MVYSLWCLCDTTTSRETKKAGQAKYKYLIIIAIGKILFNIQILNSQCISYVYFNLPLNRSLEVAGRNSCKTYDKEKNLVKIVYV